MKVAKEWRMNATILPLYCISIPFIRLGLRRRNSIYIHNKHILGIESQCLALWSALTLKGKMSEFVGICRISSGLVGIRRIWSLDTYIDVRLQSHSRYIF